jgi:cyanophycinase
MVGNLALYAALLFGQTAQPVRGQLVIVGGGPDNPIIRERMIELAGGKTAHVVIVPDASNDPKAGERTAQLWRDAGSQNVAVLDSSNPEKAAELIAAADVIWMRGGNQVRLMDALSRAKLAAAIQERFQKGAIVGGTSAGAAVISSPMIVGTMGRRGTPEANIARLADGLGLWPNVIVDQHFVRRNRLKRLESAVRSNPGFVGVGIDESTAVVVSGRGFEVIGKGDVIVVDGRKPTVAAKPKEKEPEKDGDKDGAKAKGPSDTPVELAEVTLKSGMKFDLDKGVLMPPMDTAALTGTQEASRP